MDIDDDFIKEYNNPDSWEIAHSSKDIDLFNIPWQVNQKDDGGKCSKCGEKYSYRLKKSKVCFLCIEKDIYKHYSKEGDINGISGILKSPDYSELSIFEMGIVMSFFISLGILKTAAYFGDSIRFCLFCLETKKEHPIFKVIQNIAAQYIDSNFPLVSDTLKTLSFNSSERTIQTFFHCSLRKSPKRMQYSRAIYNYMVVSGYPEKLRLPEIYDDTLLEYQSTLELDKINYFLDRYIKDFADDPSNPFISDKSKIHIPIDVFLTVEKLKDDYTLGNLRPVYNAFAADTFNSDYYIFKGAFNSTKINRMLLDFTIAMFFHTPSLVKKFISQLNEKERKLVAYLTLTKRAVSLEEVKNRFGFNDEVYCDLNSYYRNEEIKSSSSIFMLFNHRIFRLDYSLKDYYFNMKNVFADTLSKYFTDRDLDLYQLSEENRIIISSNDELYKKVDILGNFISNGFVKYNKSGNKPLVESHKKLYELTGSKDFSGLGPSYKNLKSGLIILFCDLTGVFNKQSEFADVESFFDSLFRCDLSADLILALLPYLNIDRYSFGNDDLYVCSFFEGLNNAIVDSYNGETINYDVLFSSVTRKLSNIKIFEIIASNFLFRKNTFQDNETYIYEIVIYEYCFEPIIRALLLLYASFGLVELDCYQLSDNSHRSAFESKSLPYPLINSVKLTDAGKHILKISKSDALKITVDKLKVLFDPDKLYCYTTGNNPVVINRISQYSIRISENCFKTGHELFMKNCKTEGDLKQVVDFFKKLSEEPLPDNWNNFFNSLKERINPFKIVMDYVVLKLDQTASIRNKIVEDDALSSMVLKAENGHVLIKEKDFVKFKNKLNKEGFII